MFIERIKVVNFSCLSFSAYFVDLGDYYQIDNNNKRLKNDNNPVKNLLGPIVYKIKIRVLSRYKKYKSIVCSCNVILLLAFQTVKSNFLEIETLDPLFINSFQRM